MVKSLIFIVLTLSAYLYAEDDNGLTKEEMEATKKQLFQEFKQNKINFISKQIEALNIKKDCVMSAEDHNGIQACQKTLKQSMRDVRKSDKIKMKDLREKRRKALQN